MNEKISIIIPVYNLEKYIKRTAESVLKQTYTNIEVIIVDDGSSDESWKIIQKIADKDNRVIPILRLFLRFKPLENGEKIMQRNIMRIYHTADIK